MNLQSRSKNRVQGLTHLTNSDSFWSAARIWRFLVAALPVVLLRTLLRPSTCQRLACTQTQKTLELLRPTNPPLPLKRKALCREVRGQQEQLSRAKHDKLVALRALRAAEEALNEATETLPSLRIAK